MDWASAWDLRGQWFAGDKVFFLPCLATLPPPLPVTEVDCTHYEFDDTAVKWKNSLEFKEMLAVCM
jgi:hypothetical protein